MMEWQPIETVPDEEDDRVLVYVPGYDPPVFEARADRDGSFYDPVYWEWFGAGATHWMPLPEPPQ